MWDSAADACFRGHCGSRADQCSLFTQHAGILCSKMAKMCQSRVQKAFFLFLPEKGKLLFWSAAGGNWLALERPCIRCAYILRGTSFHGIFLHPVLRLEQLKKYNFFKT